MTRRSTAAAWSRRKFLGDHHETLAGNKAVEAEEPNPMTPSEMAAAFDAIEEG